MTLRGEVSEFTRPDYPVDEGWALNSRSAPDELPQLKAPSDPGRYFADEVDPFIRCQFGNLALCRRFPDLVSHPALSTDSAGCQQNQH